MSKYSMKHVLVLWFSVGPIKWRNIFDVPTQNNDEKEMYWLQYLGE